MTLGGKGPVMTVERVDAILESGFRWARTKLMRGRNMRKNDMGTTFEEFQWCLGRIKDETEELEEALGSEEKDWEDICKECADIINFCCMMCARAEEKI